MSNYKLYCAIYYKYSIDKFLYVVILNIKLTYKLLNLFTPSIYENDLV